MKYIFYIASILILIILYLLKFSCKFEKINILNIQKKEDISRPIFYFLWHKSGTATIPFAKTLQKNNKIYMILSQNKSTKLMRNAFKILGCKIIDGSKHKGYLSSLKQMIQILSNKTKIGIAITPDGPRGPDMMIEDATLFKLIKRYNAQVKFLCPMTNNIFEFNTWEKIYLYKPFSKGFFINEFILTDEEIQNLQPQELRKLSENRMFFAFNEARKMCNLPKVVQGSMKKKRYGIEG